jgi:hypothetical protein
MNLQQLLDKTNQPLYDFVNSHYPVKLNQGRGTTWGAQIQFRKQKFSSLITWTPTKRPKPALVHELLHIKNQILGHKRLKLGLALDDNILKGQHGYLNVVCDAIDNEFQHQKMYPEYLSLGYKPEHFYCDSDIGTEQHLIDYLKKNNTNFIHLSVQYLTLIAPGGHISENKKNELKEEFRQQNGGVFRMNFDEIDNLISNYINDASYDAELYVKRFINNLNCGRVWISYSDKKEFIPSEGFFANSQFDINDINLAFRK